MQIKELWVKKDEDGKEYLPVNVISIGSKPLFFDGKLCDEYMSALVYDENGKIYEIPLIETYIKKIENDKTKESFTFSAP